MAEWNAGIIWAQIGLADQFDFSPADVFAKLSRQGLMNHQKSMNR